MRCQHHVAAPGHQHADPACQVTSGCLDLKTLAARFLKCWTKADAAPEADGQAIEIAQLLNAQAALAPHDGPSVIGKQHIAEGIHPISGRRAGHAKTQRLPALGLQQGAGKGHPLDLPLDAGAVSDQIQQGHDKGTVDMVADSQGYHQPTSVCGVRFDNRPQRAQRGPRQTEFQPAPTARTAAASRAHQSTLQTFSILVPPG